MGPGQGFEPWRKAPQASMLPSYITPAAFCLWVLLGCVSVVWFVLIFVFVVLGVFCGLGWLCLIVGFGVCVWCGGLFG
jgi:hypothetical protein